MHRPKKANLLRSNLGSCRSKYRTHGWMKIPMMPENRATLPANLIERRDSPLLSRFSSESRPACGAWSQLVQHWGWTFEPSSQNSHDQAPRTAVWVTRFTHRAFFRQIRVRPSPPLCHLHQLRPWIQLMASQAEPWYARGCSAFEFRPIQATSPNAVDILRAVLLLIDRMWDSGTVCIFSFPSSAPDK